MKKRVLKALAGALGFGIVFCAAMGASALKVSAETEYEYDDLNRLTEERHDDGTVIYYSYDANGNLLDVEVKDGSDAGSEDPDESSGENPGGNAGGQGGESLGNNGKHDRDNNPGSTGNGGNGKTENGQENAQGNNGENNGENVTEGLSEGSQEGIRRSGSERGIGQEEAEGEDGISENDGGSGTVLAKVLTALFVLIAALSGGFLVWKKKKSTENKG